MSAARFAGAAFGISTLGCGAYTCGFDAAWMSGGAGGMLSLSNTGGAFGELTFILFGGGVLPPNLPCLLERPRRDFL